MKKIAIIFYLITCWNSYSYCQASKADVSININSNEIINDAYIGNGAQWDPYQLNYGDTILNISNGDWQKLYKRLDFMKPQLMRVMINTTSSVRNGKLVPTLNFDHIKPILDYCQSRNVKVLFGDWGGGMVHSKSNSIDQKNLHFAAEYLDFLITKNGYSCIKYYNMINEPNGFWSATDGSYKLWSEAIKCLYKRLIDLGLNNKVLLVGPDAAIWSNEESWWIDSCATDLNKAIGLYDIHTYPSKITVNSGEYAKIIKAYQSRVPEGKKIIMGEIGFKFVDPKDSTLNKENIKRAKAKKYASIEDSQMFVYDYSYGIDMADALFQTVNSGYSGCIVWMLDDAMHSKEAKNKLKVWGFWNILGDEYFGSQEENVRPWYYAWSLLTRYMPSESRIFKITTNGTTSSDIKAIALEKDGKFMLGIVNISPVNKIVNVSSRTLEFISGAKQFVYAEHTLIKKGDHDIIPNKTSQNLNLKKGTTIKMPGKSLIIYTTFNN